MASPNSGSGRHEPLAGIIPILPTPFTADGTVDDASLRREVAFGLACGAHGLAFPGIGSEFYALTDAERDRALAVVIEEVAGRVPVVAGAIGGSLEATVAYCRAAARLGADAVFVMPPYARHPDEAGVRRLYRSIDEAIDIPVMVQNFMPPLGTPMSARLIAELAESLPCVQYVKEEVQPTSQRIAALQRACGARLRGIFGGLGGLSLVYELERGASGSMPSVAVADVQVRIYERFQRGERAEAWRLQKELLPLLVLAQQHGAPATKAVLQMRGVIGTTVVRDPQAVVLDAADRGEIRAQLESCRPLLTVPLP